MEAASSAEPLEQRAVARAQMLPQRQAPALERGQGGSQRLNEALGRERCAALRHKGGEGGEASEGGELPEEGGEAGEAGGYRGYVNALDAAFADQGGAWSISDNVFELPSVDGLLLLAPMLAVSVPCHLRAALALLALLG